MTHDPLCPIDSHPAWTECTWCDLIAKVREDERRERVALEEHIDYLKTYFDQAESRGWNTAISTCISAVGSLEPETQFSGPYQMRRAAIAAMSALIKRPHDPLCPSADGSEDIYCECDLISKARKDEHNKTVQECIDTVSPIQIGYGELHLAKVINRTLHSLLLVEDK